jgi:alpha-glucosidase
MVAEAWVSGWDRLAPYLREDEYHQAFDFEFLASPWDARLMRKAIATAIPAASGVGAVPTWVLSNHDVVRHSTRYGLPQEIDPKAWLLDGDRSLLDPERGLRRARAATLLMLGLPGSAYLYQGEELGLPEVDDLPSDVLDDPVWERSAGTEKGRDGCRVPLPWTVDGASFGFGDDGSWLPQPADWGSRSVASQLGVVGSTLELYRTAIRIRRESLVGDDSVEWIESGDQVIAFRRGGVVVMVNFGPDRVPIPDGEILLASSEITGGLLPGEAAAWIASGPDMVGEAD